MMSASGYGGTGSGIAGMIAHAKHESSPDGLKSRFNDMIEQTKEEAAKEIADKTKKSDELLASGEHDASIMAAPSMPGAPIVPMAPMPNL